MLQGYAQEVESRDGKHSRDTPSSFSGHMGAGLGPRHYTVHLRAVLLLQFMEHLDKLMYNAYEGSCVTLPPVPKVRWGIRNCTPLTVSNLNLRSLSMLPEFDSCTFAENTILRIRVFFLCSP